MVAKLPTFTVTDPIIEAAEHMLFLGSKPAAGLTARLVFEHVLREACEAHHLTPPYAPCEALSSLLEQEGVITSEVHGRNVAAAEGLQRIEQGEPLTLGAGYEVLAAVRYSIRAITRG